MLYLERMCGKIFLKVPGRAADQLGWLTGGEWGGSPMAVPDGSCLGYEETKLSNRDQLSGVRCLSRPAGKPAGYSPICMESCR